MPLEFLNALQDVEQAAAPEPAVEPVAEPAPQAEAPAQPEDQPRGPDGKFAPKDPAIPPAVEPEPAPEPQAGPQAEAAVPPGFVPLTALQEVRSELQALKATLDAPKRPAQQPPQPAPDPYEDFEAYRAHQENQQAIERANWSRQLAEAKTDPDTVAKAHEWAAARADKDPIFAQRAWISPDPYGLALEEYQRDQALTLLSDPKLLEQFRAFQAGQAPALATPQPAPAPVVAAPPPIAPSAPPRSIATAPSAGGPATVPIGPGQAYDGLFKG